MAIGNLPIERYVPVVKLNEGLYTKKAVDFSDAASVALPAATTIAGTTAAGTSTITSTDANALTVGRQGATDPVLKINASATTVATGVSITGAAAASGVAVAAISSGTNENLTIDAKGSGTVTINATGTGAITLGRATTITTGNLTVTNGSVVVTANASQLSFTGTGANGGVLKNLKNAAASSLSGTQLDVEILIGTTPYYFTVYPTKA